jgi:hypothetical protein
MDEAKIKELDLRLDTQNRLLLELRDGQAKIANALLGTLDKSSVGLIEETRNLRKEVDYLVSATENHQTQISDLAQFKRDIKKIVVAIAVCIPFIFELAKMGFVTLWEIIQKR